MVKLEQFLKDNESLLRENNLDGLYDKTMSVYIKYLVTPKDVTSFFLKLGINPLEYMTKVPRGFASGLNITLTSIPNSITIIESASFFECGNLKQIKIPNSVTEIGEEAFYQCINLNFISISNNLKIIYRSSFYKCNNLK